MPKMTHMKRQMNGVKRDRSMRMASGGGRTDRSMRNPAANRGMSGKGMSTSRKK